MLDGCIKACWYRFKTYDFLFGWCDNGNNTGSRGERITSYDPFDSDHGRQDKTCVER